MRVFVAGATGTLGMPLVRALVAQKHQVTGLTRSPEKRRVLEQAGAQAAVADALDAASLEQALGAAQPECVFHLLLNVAVNHTAEIYREIKSIKAGKDVFKELADLGAEELRHPSGSLMSHLEGTRREYRHVFGKER